MLNYLLLYIAAAKISIFDNSLHLEWRAGLSDTIFKWDHPSTIPAKLGLSHRQT